MTQSKVNPSNPDANDYTWQARESHTLRAGQLQDGEDVCYLEDVAPCFTPDNAIQLASDLLGWATFVKECAATKANDAEFELLMHSQSPLFKRPTD